MDALISAFLSVTSIFFIPLTAEFVSYIKPQDDVSDYAECSHDHPCLTLGNCIQQQDTCFISNAELILLPGIHQLDSQLSLENLTNVTLQGDDDPSNRSVIVFAPLAHVNWTNCTNISINYLMFLLSGTADSTHFFISMQFLRSINIRLSAVIFSGGHDRLYSTAVRCYESSIDVCNSTFIGCSSYIGAGIMGYRCSLYSDSSFFINNSAQVYGGGAITTFQSKFVFTGNSSFIGNRVLTLSGGAISSFESEIEMRGNSVFIRNSATGPLLLGRGGAVLSNDGRLHISGNACFINNSAGFQGGGLCAHNTSVNLNGSIYFIDNAARLGGGGINLATESKMHGEGLYFIRNRKLNAAYSNVQYQNIGGGIYAFNRSHLYLVGSYFENNTATAGAGIAMSSYSTGILANNVAIGNKAEASGGAIYLERSTLLLIGGNNLTNNSAEIFGGAIFTLTSNTSLNGTNYISSNTVLLSGGGGLYFSFSNATIGGIFMLQHNTVRYFGGGIYGGYVIFQYLKKVK